MSKKEPITYNFPREMEREYHLLMHSKDSFLSQKNLSLVEKRKLIISYEQLESVWVRSNIEPLRQRLLMKSAELREMQRVLEQKCEQFKIDIQKQLRNNLDQRKSFLTERQKSLLNQTKVLEEKLLIWKNDILEKEEKLQQHKATTNQVAKQRLTELQETWYNWEQVEVRLRSEKVNLQQKQHDWNELIKMSKQKLKILLEERKKLSTVLLHEEQSYQNIIEKLRSELDRNLSSKKDSSEIILQQVKQKCEQTLSVLEENQLKLLREKMTRDHPVSIDGLAKLLKQADFSTLWRQKAILFADSEKLKQLLIRELIKIGFELDGFLEKMELMEANGVQMPQSNRNSSQQSSP